MARFSSTPRILSLGFLLVGAALSLQLLAGCNARGKGPTTPPKDRDTLVPQATQREAEQQYGAQEAFGQSLGQTPSEQAGAAHDAAVERARDPAGENRKKK